MAEGNGELIQYGQSLDKSRPWTHVSNCFNKKGWESFYRFDDVIVVNVYPSHHISLARTNLDARLPEATKYMEKVLARLHRQFPAKPIVIGEFGYPGGERLPVQRQKPQRTGERRHSRFSERGHFCPPRR